MIGIIKETQSGQVSTELEKQIRSGRLAPGRKIPSIRELAQRFDVSSQVIKSALELLEQRNLVVSQPRIGVYVNPGGVAPLKRELCLLTIRRHDHVTDYPNRLLSLHQTSLWEQFNFSTRAVSADQLNAETIRYELEKLREVHPDCLLVHMSVDEKLLQDFLSLPFPVVFLGDFDTEIINGYHYNQIVEDTAERAVAMVNAAVSSGAKSAVMLGGSKQCYYGRLLYNSGMAAAKTADIDFNHVEFSDAACTNVAELEKIRQRQIDSILRQYHPDALLLDGYRQVDIFARALRERGFNPGQNFTVVTDTEMCPGCVFLQSDFRDFSLRALKLIEKVIADPAHPFGRAVISNSIRRHPLSVATLPSNFNQTVNI